MSAGTLFLIPTFLGDGPPEATLPAAVSARVRALGRFIVEEPKAARAFLKRVGHPGPLASVAIEPLPKTADDAAVERLLAPVRAGADAGLLSEAGAPAVADPGAALVRRAHELAIRVTPLVGPSAILLALMASGLDGQRFAFHGYLPVDEPTLASRLKALEAESRRDKRTQIFIETPYRNDRLLRVIAATCAPATRVCVAIDLTGPDEAIEMKTVAQWRRSPRAIGKRPAVFLLLA